MTDLQKEQIKKFRIQGLGYGTIAKQMGLSMDTVKSHCKLHGLGSVRSIHAPALNVDGITCCKNCGIQLVQIKGRKKKMFCCDKCRMTWWNSHGNYVRKKAWHHITCQHCGKAFDVYGNAGRKYCCHECYIADRFGE